MPVTISQLRNIRISTRQFGSFRLRRIAVADLENLEQITEAELSASEFIVVLLRNHLVTPELTLNELRQLPGPLSIHVARVWLRKSRITVGEQNAGTGTAEGIRSAVRDYLASWSSKLVDDAAQSARSAGQLVAAWGLQNIADMVESYRQNVVRSLLNVFPVRLPEILLPRIDIPNISNIVNLKPIISPTMLLSIGGLTNLVSTQFAFASFLPMLNVGINSYLAATFASIQQNIETLQSQVTSQFLLVGNRWARWIAEVDAAEAVFADTGYGFAEFLPIRFIVQSTRRNPRTRHALVTLQLAAYLRSARFEEELQSLFVRSKILRRRWKSVIGGLHGHQQRDYQKSALTWLREVEGMFKDLLVVMRNAQRIGESYVATKNGIPLYTKSGKPRILDGIDSAVQHVNFDRTAPMYKVTQALNDDFRKDRNPISHGSRYDYQTAKLSVQGLLMVRMLAEEIVRLEAIA